MKTTLFSTLLILLIVSTLYLPKTFAQDYFKWNLPTGAKARLGKGYIYEIRYAPDGTLLAVASSIGVWLYDARTGEERNLLTDRTSSVHSVAFSPDGQTLASGGADGNIALWDANTGEYLKTLTGHRDVVRSLAFSPDGQTLASGGADDNIHLWDVATGEQSNILFTSDMEFVTSLAFSPDGQTLAGAEGRIPIDEVRVPIIGVFLVDDPPEREWDNIIRLWDANTGKEKNTLTGHTDVVVNLVFSPDGATIVSTSWDKTVRLWDANTGAEKNTLTGHTDIVANLVFSPDGAVIAGANWREIHLWDATTRTHLKTLTESITGESQRRHGLLDGARDVYPIYTPWLMDAVRSLAFSPDGQTLAGTNGGAIHLWNTDTWTYLKTFTKHTNLVNSLALSPNSAILASGGWKEVHLWDTDTGIHLKTLTKHTDVVTSLAFSPDGAKLASASGGEVHFWDTDTGTHLKTFTGPQNIVRTLVFGPDGTRLASVSWQEDYIVHLWDIVAGTHLKTLTEPGDFIRTIRSEDSLWDAPNSAPIQILTGPDRDSWALSTDGRISAGTGINGNIYLYGRATGTHLKTFIGHPERENHVAFSADNSTLVSSGIDGTMFLWDLTLVPIEKIPGDVNKDGIVNIQDLTLVAANFGQTGPNSADVNRDGIVNIADLVLVAGVIGTAATAPSVHLQTLAMLTAADVQQWLFQAQQLNLTDPVSQRGIRFLEQLVMALTPKETALLPNYPNPFNPETWIPYQLAEAAEVTLTLYAVDGTVVRTLELGHQPVGVYEDRHRAARWDGTNELGESVASGVYFYALTAGEFKATRKMLIRE